MAGSSVACSLASQFPGKVPAAVGEVAKLPERMLIVSREGEFNSDASLPG